MTAQTLPVRAGSRSRSAWPGLLAASGSVLVTATAIAAPRQALVLLAAAAVTAAVAWPSVGLFAMVIVAPASVALTGDSSVNSLLAALVAATLIGLALRHRVAHGPAGRAGRWAVLLALYLAASWLFATTQDGELDGRTAIAVAGSVVAPLLMLPLLPSLGRLRSGLFVVFASAVAALGGAYVAFARAQLASTDIQPAWTVVSSAASAHNHNELGALFVLALSVLLPASVAARARWQRFLAALASVLLIVAVLYSFSRASYIALVVVLAVFLLRRRLRVLAAGLLLAVVAVQFVPVTVWQRISYTNSAASGLDPSSALRLDLWGAAVRMFFDHPLFGVGFQAFPRELPRYFTGSTGSPSFSVDPSLLVYAHNTFLTVVAQLGLVGLLLCGALVVAHARRFRRAAAGLPPWHRDAALLATVGIAAASLFGEPLLTPAVLLPFLVVISAGRHAERP